jgi:hypothetical protein
MLTYLEYARAVAIYLDHEWPAIACAIRHSGQCNRAAVRATLDAFLSDHTPQRAAGDVAFAASEFVTAD